MSNASSMLFALVLLLTTSLMIDLASASAPTCGIPDSLKKDCGYPGINNATCANRSCCWEPDYWNSSAPWCFFPEVAPPLPPIPPAGQPPFNDSEVALMRSFFLANVDIQGFGGVVASPDTQTPGGSYYYHWERDGALSIHAAMLTAAAFSDVSQIAMDYTQWVLRVQALQDPNGIDVRAEPKYFLPDGGVYTGGWCRPQTDGPALRANTLSYLAEILLNEGDSDYIKQYLYTSGAYNGGAIRYDLEFIIANWQMQTCDLWEEVRANDFFWGRFNMKHALYAGGALATRLGDITNAQRFNATAATIAETLGSYYTGLYVYESTVRMQDSAVICAFNDGYDADDGLYGPTDYRVANTILTLNSAFTSAFPINVADTNNGVPGILYGRYPNDHYAGGNPWILCTGCLASLYYRGASDVMSKGRLPSARDLEPWLQLLGLEKQGLTHIDLALALSDAGDGVLKRIRYHTEGAGFHLSEQLDKNNGYEVSATDLTWSYATVLKSMYYRNIVQQQFIDAGVKAI